MPIKELLILLHQFLLILCHMVCWQLKHLSPLSISFLPISTPALQGLEA